METIKYMLKDLHWANQRILASLQKSEEEKKQANNPFSHILHAENVWLTRLKGTDS